MAELLEVSLELLTVSAKMGQNCEEGGEDGRPMTRLFFFFFRKEMIDATQGGGKSILSLYPHISQPGLAMSTCDPRTLEKVQED